MLLHQSNSACGAPDSSNGESAVPAGNLLPTQERLDLRRQEIVSFCPVNSGPLWSGIQSWRRMLREPFPIMPIKPGICCWLPYAEGFDTQSGPLGSPCQPGFPALSTLAFVRRLPISSMIIARSRWPGSHPGEWQVELCCVPLHRDRISTEDTRDVPEAHAWIHPGLSQRGAPMGPVISHPGAPPAIQGDIGVPAVGTP